MQPDAEGGGMISPANEPFIAATVQEYRLRREFRGKSGIEGTDYVALGVIPSPAAFTHAANHRIHARHVYVESRCVTEWQEEQG